jgi:cytochrome c1|tara:strand:- start:364 stop:519 length:156 start_codon:yes stop_codon:yes gene_type:complete
MRDPAEFRDDFWEPSVLHMRLRAGLTGQETRDILTFLQKANDPADNKGENK